MSEPVQTEKQTALLRLHVAGLQIDVKCSKGLVVDLAVSAQEQDGTLIGRIRQHLANALRRAAGACHAGQDYGTVRVTEVVVAGHCLDDAQTRRAGLHIFQRIASRKTNGQTHYQTLAVHEGVVDGIDDMLAGFGINGCRGHGADDLQAVPPEFWRWATKPLILPQSDQSYGAMRDFCMTAPEKQVRSAKCGTGTACHHQAECDDFLCPGRPAGRQGAAPRSQEQAPARMQGDTGWAAATFVATMIIIAVCTWLLALAMLPAGVGK